MLCLKRKVSQTLKSSSCKKVFPKSVHHGCNLLRWMFFIRCDNWKTFFLIQTYCYPEVSRNHHVSALFETSILKKVRILYSFFHNNITMLLIPQCSYFLHILNEIYFLIAVFYSFCLWMLDVKNVPHFSL